MRRTHLLGCSSRRLRQRRCHALCEFFEEVCASGGSRPEKEESLSPSSVAVLQRSRSRVRDRLSRFWQASFHSPALSSTRRSSMIELIIAGNVGSVRYQALPETSILNISVASMRRSGEKEYTVWIAAKVWGARAEKLRPFIKVGQKLLLRGRPDVCSYRRDDETCACQLVLHVWHLQFLSPRATGNTASCPESSEKKVGRKQRKSVRPAAQNRSHRE